MSTQCYQNLGFYPLNQPMEAYWHPATAARVGWAKLLMHSHSPSAARILVGICLGLLSLSSIAQSPPEPPRPAPPAPTSTDGTTAPPLVYLPPRRGAPRVKIGGGTRSINQLQALAPASHVGLSSSDQPRLYWYLAPGFRQPVQFHLAEAEQDTPLLELDLGMQIAGGIYSLDLAKRQPALHLKPDVLYQWWLTLEPPPGQSGNRLISSAKLQLGTADAQLKKASPRERPYQAAQQGLWYDAIDSIAQLLEHEPAKASQWHGLRADLLEQAGLKEAALSERENAKANQP